MTKEEFINYCKDINIKITEELYNDLYNYFVMLKEWNNKFNLTSILEEKDVFLLHFYDSLCLSKTIDLNSIDNLLDFGTGAGFPGMVIALLFKNINVTLIESNNKKCIFLNEVKEKLKLNNVDIINDRIENYGIKNREKFDVVTCRAVTSIPMIIELSTSTIKVGGYLLPLKSDCKEELEKYKYLNKEFNLELEKVFEYNLPINNAIRMIPKYKKTGITNSKYPRNYGTIIKKYKNN
jgi:16S rRNA (guanine527-N7)-methyltransferase